MYALFFMTRMAAAAASTAADRAIGREIERHVRAIALYEDESGSTDAQLREFAQRILPQLHRHLAMLRRLERETDLPSRETRLKPRS
jgi:predicted outer membrane protein